MGKWTRRGVIAAGIAGGGVFAVGVALREGHRAPGLAGRMAGDGETLVNVWVKLSEDNIVTAIVPHAEMGQGVFTSMAQMLAEEMDADWNLVRFEQAPADEAYANYPLAREYLLGGATVPGLVQDTLNGGFLRLSQSMSLQITGGSTAVRFTGQGGMRIAGAAARDMLIKAAARDWQVPRRTLRAEKSYIYHDASGRAAPFSDFAVAAGKLSPPTQPKLKSPEAYTLMGTSLPRLDLAGKVDGSAEFSIDVQLPNLRHAAVLSAPVFGARTVSVDDSGVARMPGIYKTVNGGNFVAVIADSYWRAEQAVAALDVTWSETGREALGQADIDAQFVADMARAVDTEAERIDVKAGQARQAAQEAPHVIEADYTVPYLAHAALEPINATAHVQGDKLDIWIGHQNPLGARDAIAAELDFRKKDITVHNRLLGGAFGRKSEVDYPIMAVRIAQEADGPVKMIWSRSEDTKQDFYRPASRARIIAGLDTDHQPLSWDYQFVHKHEPVEASDPPYDIANKLIHYADSDNPIRFGAWRSVDHTQHGFFIESFIDELAHAANADPLTYRRNLLLDKPRHLAALDAVAKAAGWGRATADGRGLGVAIVESFGTIVAQIAEVDTTGPVPRVVKVWAAADPGFVVHPDGFKAQIEGGIIYGLSAALYGNITVENGAISQSNFHDYPVVRMDDAPDISITLINSGAQLGGGGEPGTPPIAPAVANAIFAASGRRMRSLPLAVPDGGLASAPEQGPQPA